MTQPPTDSARGVDGWRLLAPEEIHCEGDERYGAYTDYSWGPIDPSRIGTPNQYAVARRRIDTWRDSLQARPVGGDADHGTWTGAEWQRQSCQALAKQLRARRDDLSQDAATWLEMFGYGIVKKSSAPPQVEPVSGGEGLSTRLRALAKRLDTIGCADVQDAEIKAAVIAELLALTAPVCDRVAGEGEIEALRKDAERYRFLRAQHEIADEHIHDAHVAIRWTVFRPTSDAYRPCDIEPIDCDPGSLDSAIDAAIASTLAPAALNGGDDHG